MLLLLLLFSFIDSYSSDDRKKNRKPIGYKDYVIDLQKSNAERQVTEHMIAERSRVITNRMESLKDYMQEEDISIAVWQEYQKLKSDYNIIEEVLTHLKPNYHKKEEDLHAK